MNKNMKKIIMTIVIISTLIIGGFLGKDYILLSDKTSNSIKLSEKDEKNNKKKNIITNVKISDSLEDVKKKDSKLYKGNLNKNDTKFSSKYDKYSFEAEYLSKYKPTLDYTIDRSTNKVVSVTLTCITNIYTDADLAEIRDFVQKNIGDNMDFYMDVNKNMYLPSTQVYITIAEANKLNETITQNKNIDNELLQEFKKSKGLS